MDWRNMALLCVDQLRYPYAPDVPHVAFRAETLALAPSHTIAQV